MHAILYHTYGSPDVLKYENVETPVPNDNEVLIKVYAASVNPFDWHFMRGTPYFLLSSQLAADADGAARRRCPIPHIPCRL